MSKTLHALYIGLFFIIGGIALTLLIINGFDYYSLPLELRPFSDKHHSLKPSGIIGHGLGIIGTLMMIIGVSTYMIRKRVRKFFTFGYLKHWLEFHIFLCSVGPLLVLFHTAFKFGGIVSISFWSMVIVVLSGVVGRFIYIQVPRSIQGNELTITELNNLDSKLWIKIEKEYQVNSLVLEKIKYFIARYKSDTDSLAKGLLILVKDLFKIPLLMRQVKQQLFSEGIKDKLLLKQVIKSIKSKVLLTRRVELLKTMQKLFRYWHIFHLPFAISMFIIMLIHVTVTIIFGYQWIF